MKVTNGRETITSRIAYLAGFFDGEGCIRIKKASKKGNSYYLWVAVTNSNRSILEEYENLFGGKIRKAERRVNKDIYHWLITASEAYDYLKIVRNFLREKQAQADLAMQYHERKSKLSPNDKRDYVELISKMKREIIGNIYENPELKQNYD